MLSFTSIVAIVLGAIAGFAFLCALAAELANYISETIQRHGHLGYIEIHHESECEKGLLDSVAFSDTPEKSKVQCAQLNIPGAAQWSAHSHATTTQEPTIYKDDTSRHVSQTLESQYIDILEDEDTNLSTYLPPAYNDLASMSPAHMASVEEWQRSEKIATHLKRSVHVSELEGVDFGSMGTRGIRVVKGDREMEGGEEE